MSIQWTFIAGYLYFEIGIVIIMMLPIFSPRRWNQFFKSRLFSMFQQHAAVYFYVLLGVLSLFLLDAVREMRKYSHATEGAHVHLSSEMKGNVKLFRAQRNFYITGFAIFLAFVIRRLVTMLIIQDELTIKAEKIIKEAESTVKLAKTTVLANTMQSEENKKYEEVKSKLEETEDMLILSQERVKVLEDDIKKWKLKYEELNAQITGKGDEP
ncbi:B-cell receptor-associated protein 31-like [Pectinophora gossypiella]|uniref:Endoplasmic reticulum transmembrane protein n=1 Tax=Pectinophora gossypiella TaxID=13191 RepID=A0A1E1WAP1_PECGO|nr:B-cell receptor-associated protein 31-like [Pectinophora gossypiella]